jgi:hypothetical protein
VYLQQKVVMQTACDAVACNHTLHKIQKIVEGRRLWLITCSATTMHGQVQNALQLLFTNVS